MTLFEVLKQSETEWMKHDIPCILLYQYQAQAILSWFKEQLPEERKPMVDDFSFYENGYNCCLRDILNKLDKEITHE
jgi:hypothetical protein